MDISLLIHLAVAVVGIVGLIVWGKVNPVVSLIVGSLYLGVATGLGFGKTVLAVNEGFGLLMAEVGLIIGFGVMIGTTLSVTGTLQRVVDRLLAIGGPRRSPYVLGLTAGIVFPSIYFDVALVILAPIAGAISKRTGRSIASLAGSVAIGLEAALLLVVPGVAAVAVAGRLKVDLGTVLLWGVPLGIVLIITSIWLHDRLMRVIFDPATDREPDFDDSIFGVVDAGHDGARANAITGPSSVDDSTGATTHASADTFGDVAVHTRIDPDRPSGTGTSTVRELPLVIAMLPVILPILLIIINTVLDITGHRSPFVAFLGSPVVALLIGLLVGFVLATLAIGREGVDDVITKGAQVAGSILLFTGVAGSLGQVITEVGIGGMLAEVFSANTAVPVLLAWAVAAMLRLAQGSASVAAITAATLLAPVMGEIATPPVLILLASGCGAAFGGHVTDNTFWIFKQMLGFTTKGTFKIYTCAQSTLALVGLVACLALDVIF